MAIASVTPTPVLRWERTLFFGMGTPWRGFVLISRGRGYRNFISAAKSSDLENLCSSILYEMFDLESSLAAPWRPGWASSASRVDPQIYRPTDHPSDSSSLSQRSASCSHSNR